MSTPVNPGIGPVLFFSAWAPVCDSANMATDIEKIRGDVERELKQSFKTFTGLMYKDVVGFDYSTYIVLIEIGEDPRVVCARYTRKPASNIPKLDTCGFTEIKL
ncbi:hypothetical protein BaRGS_00011114, partial [Batillaria attramentaria]